MIKLILITLAFAVCYKAQACDVDDLTDYKVLVEIRPQPGMTWSLMK